MPVEIKLFFDEGDTTFTVFNNAQVQTFNFITKQKTNVFKVDPDNKILCKITGDEPVTPVLSLIHICLYVHFSGRVKIHFEHNIHIIRLREIRYGCILLFASA